MNWKMVIGLVCGLPLTLMAHMEGSRGQVVKHFHLGSDGYSEVSHIYGDNHNPEERSADDVDFVGETPPFSEGDENCGSYCNFGNSRKWADFKEHADYPTRQSDDWFDELH